MGDSESRSTAVLKNERHERALRGQRLFIPAQVPGAVVFVTILDNTTETEWMGQAMAPGLWRFQGYAVNQHGQGASSAIVEIQVASAQAA